MWTAIAIASFFFVFYTYAGYPLLLRYLAGRQSIPEADSAYAPSATVVIAAFNEAACIGETVASILASDYSKDLLDVIVVSDRSTDKTAAAVREFPADRVQCIEMKKRMGQTACLIHGARMSRGEIVFFCDASGRFQPQTVRRMMRHFANPSVGAASGFSSVEQTGTAVAKGDGVYVRYDKTLRFLESQTGSSWVGCQGGTFAVRRSLLKADFPLHLAADNAICYELYEQHYLHRFDPTVMVLEPPPKDLKNEFRRKVRIIVLQLHGIFHFRRLFVPWKHPNFFFQNISHKVFRWLAPWALIALWVACGINPQPWAQALFWTQCIFYGLALIGYFYAKWRKAPLFLSIPAYFVTVNLAGLLAWGMLFKNYTLWKPPSRDLS